MWGLTELSPEEAKRIVERHISNSSTIINLPKLTTISPEIATELAKYEGSLFLTWLTNLSKDIAEKLATKTGEQLSLDWLTTLEKDTAEELAKFNWLLTLDSLTSLNKDVASVLANHTWILQLNSLTTIDKETATELAKKTGNVNLNWLTTVDVDVAFILQNTEWKFSIDDWEKIEVVNP